MIQTSTQISSHKARMWMFKLGCVCLSVGCSDSPAPPDQPLTTVTRETVFTNKRDDSTLPGQDELARIYASDKSSNEKRALAFLAAFAKIESLPIPRSEVEIIASRFGALVVPVPAMGGDLPSWFSNDDLDHIYFIESQVLRDAHASVYLGTSDGEVHRITIGLRRDSLTLGPGAHRSKGLSDL